MKKLLLSFVLAFVLVACATAPVGPMQEHFTVLNSTPQAVLASIAARATSTGAIRIGELQTNTLTLIQDDKRSQIVFNDHTGNLDSATARHTLTFHAFQLGTNVQVTINAETAFFADTPYPQVSQQALPENFAAEIIHGLNLDGIKAQ